MASTGKNVSHKVETIPLNLSDVEMIFGRADGKKEDDVHLIVNERRHNELKPASNGPHKAEENQPNQPLLEPDRGKQKPPLAGPEIDDLDDETPINKNKPYPGIDDGLLDPEDKTPGHTDPHDPDGDVDKELPPTHHDGADTDEGKWWISGDDQPDYPYDVNGIGTRFGADDLPGSPLPGIIPDVNTYQQKKNLAQGFLDLALFTANANQLRYVIETSSAHPYFYFSLASIALSLILQIAVGVGLILNSRYNVKDDKDICKADKINNMTVLGIFLITIVNVFIAAFSVAPTSTGIPALPAPVQQAG